MQACLEPNALERRDVDVFDLRGHAGDETRLVEAEMAQRKGGLAVYRACTSSLVARFARVNLILQVGIGDCSTNAIGIWVEMTDNVYLADGIG